MVTKTLTSSDKIQDIDWTDFSYHPVLNSEGYVRESDKPPDKLKYAPNGKKTTNNSKNGNGRAGTIHNGQVDIRYEDLLVRNDFWRQLLIPRGPYADAVIDPRRDIFGECGYPRHITPWQFRWMYDREGIGTRVVDIYPEECWVLDPEILESQDRQYTKFEKAWIDLEEQYNLWHYLERADKLSGIGYFGCVLLGIDDGQRLDQPIDGIDERTGVPTKKLNHKLVYIRCFDETQLRILRYEGDQSSPRYGQPTMYLFRFIDITQGEYGAIAGVVSSQVHWTRVVHLADERKSSEVFGTPRMQKVFNRVYDIQKIMSGSGEMFWKGAFPGIAFEVNPEIAAEVNLDVNSLRKEFEEYSNGLQRYLALMGVQAKSLNPQVANPARHFETHIKAICASIGVPYRIIMGSEESKLASEQDKRAWVGRVGRRQQRYVTPMVVKPLANRLIHLGVLPPPESGSYDTIWPDLLSANNLEKAELGFKRTQALAQYLQVGVQNLIPPREYLSVVLDLPEQQVEAILAAAAEQLQRNGGKPISPMGGDDGSKELSGGVAVKSKTDDANQGSAGQMPKPGPFGIGPIEGGGGLYNPNYGFGVTPLVEIDSSQRGMSNLEKKGGKRKKVEMVSADVIDEDLLNKIKSVLPTSEIPTDKLPHLCGTIDDRSGEQVDIIIIDGDKTMLEDTPQNATRERMDFYAGGNGMEDPSLCKRNQTVLDDNTEPREWLPNAYHECFERRDMAMYGLTYDQAHIRANKGEKLLRTRIIQEGESNGEQSTGAGGSGTPN